MPEAKAHKPPTKQNKTNKKRETEGRQKGRGRQGEQVEKRKRTRGNVEKVSLRDLSLGWSLVIFNTSTTSLENEIFLRNVKVMMTSCKNRECLQCSWHNVNHALSRF